MKEQLLNSAINHLKKSPVLQEAVSAADSFMDHFSSVRLKVEQI